MSKLIVSVSGVRGIIGDSLTPEVVFQFGAAFGSLNKGGKIVLGRDSRVSGPMLSSAVIAGLISTGCKVVDIGITSTPTVQIMAKELNADGGIEITASHNPAMWNGLKFLSAEGLFVSERTGEKIKQAALNKEYAFMPWDKLGSISQNSSAVKIHIQKVLSLPYLDVDAVRKRRFKVFVDTVNGSGGGIIPELLKQLGCEATVLNEEMNGHFAHEPEPLPKNLKQLSGEVVKRKADIGFAVDPDVDRCAIVDEKGNPIGEEYTLVIAAKLVLSKKKGKVTVNVSTSMAIDDVAREYGCPVERTRVGEINVALKMKDNKSVVGGEGNGGVMIPDIHIGRDAPVACALALQYLLESGKTLSEIKETLPKYVMFKGKVGLEDKEPKLILEELKKLMAKEKVDETDGLKIIRGKSWVHIRGSNTEPIVRIYAEAENLEKAKSLHDEFREKVLSISSEGSLI